MNIEIRSHFWPATPDLREIKIFIDGELIRSSFLNYDQIWSLAKQFRHFDQELMDIGNELHDEVISR